MPKLRRTRLLITVGAAGAVIALAAGTDRAMVIQAQSQAAEAFQDAVNAAEQPTVRIDGFPALPQIASGTLDNVHITAQQIPPNLQNGRPVPITTLRLRMQGLKQSDDASQAHARSARATAFLAYEDLSRALRMDVGPAEEPGQVAVTVRLPLLGSVTITATPAPDGPERLVLREPRVTGGSAGPGVQSALDRLFPVAVPLRDLPDGLRLDQVVPGPEGITAQLSGENVTFRSERT
ncbi:DUF2993 domain-containing protein [Streptomyces sp. NPDC006422]|uniref:LmeA family phospholipid-binding protein n=1 Tax=unclassified Streptomyces TaxID=2593676 RepID=UPI0033BDC01D